LTNSTDDAVARRNPEGLFRQSINPNAKYSEEKKLKPKIYKKKFIPQSHAQYLQQKSQSANAVAPQEDKEVQETKARKDGS